MLPLCTTTVVFISMAGMVASASPVNFTPAAVTESTNTTTLIKRTQFYPGNQKAGEDDWCEKYQMGQFTRGNSNRAKSADCEAILQDIPTPGYWLITLDDTKAHEKNGRWVQIAKHSTCAFDVRLSKAYKQDRPENMWDFKFGTEDMWWAISNYAWDPDTKDGTVQVWSGLWCHPKVKHHGKQMRVDWRMVHA